MFSLVFTDNNSNSKRHNLHTNLQPCQIVLFLKVSLNPNNVNEWMPYNSSVNNLRIHVFQLRGTGLNHCKYIGMIILSSMFCKICIMLKGLKNHNKCFLFFCRFIKLSCFFLFWEGFFLLKIIVFVRFVVSYGLNCGVPYRLRMQVACSTM